VMLFSTTTSKSCYEVIGSYVYRTSESGGASSGICFTKTK